jgi:hypothetical protein
VSQQRPVNGYASRGDRGEARCDENNRWLSRGHLKSRLLALNRRFILASFPSFAQAVSGNGAIAARFFCSPLDSHRDGRRILSFFGCWALSDKGTGSCILTALLSDFF